jgi:flagellar assembly protein FliH
VQPVAFSFADISGRAEDYLGEIRSKAGTIIAEAHEEAEKIRRRAEVAGRQAAEDAVERILNDKVASQMATLQPAIEQLVTQLNDARSTWQEHWDHAGVKLAVAIAHRILRREVEQDPALTLEFAREALEMATGASGVVLHLSPADFKNLGEQAARLAESIGQLAPTEIVADAAVTPGGCRVETRFGQIDMQLESQLARIEQELTD